MFVKPSSVSLGANWKASSGTALSCITGSGKEVESPTAPSLTSDIESITSSEVANATEVKFEATGELKEALEAGKKVLSYKTFIYGSNGTTKHLTTQIYKNSESEGTLGECIGSNTNQWFSSELTSAKAEAINSIAKWNEFNVKFTKAAGGKANVYELYIAVAFESPGVTSKIAMII